VDASQLQPDTQPDFEPNGSPNMLDRVWGALDREHKGWARSVESTVGWGARLPSIGGSNHRQGNLKVGFVRAGTFPRAFRVVRLTSGGGETEKINTTLNQLHKLADHFIKLGVRF
jgi:hypothetical protein